MIYWPIFCLPCISRCTVFLFRPHSFFSHPTNSCISARPIRLYHAPTESPAKSPAAAEKSPAQSRSLIRRRSRASNPEQVRERRRRILASTIDYSAYELRERSHYEGRSVRRPPPATAPDPDGPEMRRLYLARALIAEREEREREERNRAAHTGNEGLTFHRSDNVAPPAGGSEDREMMSSQAGVTPDPDQLPRPRLVTLPTGPYALSNLRSTQDPAYPNTLVSSRHFAQYSVNSLSSSWQHLLIFSRLTTPGTHSARMPLPLCPVVDQAQVAPMLGAATRDASLRSLSIAFGRIYPGASHRDSRRASHRANHHASHRASNPPSLLSSVMR
jgi:hypothetical protein